MLYRVDLGSHRRHLASAVVVRNRRRRGRGLVAWQQTVKENMNITMAVLQTEHALTN